MNGRKLVSWLETDILLTSFDVTHHGLAGVLTTDVRETETEQERDCLKLSVKMHSVMQSGTLSCRVNAWGLSNCARWVYFASKTSYNT